MKASHLTVPITVIGILWLLDLPRRLGLLVITEQYLALMIGLAVLAGLVVAPLKGRLHVVDWLFGLACLAAWCWLAWNYEVWLLDPVNRGPEKWVPAVVAIAGVIEATRRHCGMVLGALAVAFIAYGLFGAYAPGIFEAAELAPERFILYLYSDTNGIPGLVLGVGATQILGFIVFGAVLNAVGGSRVLTDLAMAAMGHRRGGPAKVAILASSLFGTLSGSTVANVMSTGVVTIPMMKRSGFPARYAAAIEAVASNGGQIAPPVMGATAFVIAEFLQVSYATVVLAALLPAVAYYLMLYLQVDRYAAVHGLEGTPRAELPPLGASFAKAWPLLMPLGVLIWFLFGLGYAPGKAALYAAFVSYGLYLVTAPRAAPRLSLLGVIAQNAGVILIPVLLVCAIAGIIIGTINITGLGFALTLALGRIAELGGVLALLAVTALIAIILGVGMPTTGVYVVVSVLLAPALVKAGIGQMSAHLFIFYFGLLSMLTPPVAIASYAAASLAESDMWRTGVTGMRLAVVAYLIPFAFAFNPALLLDGTWLEITISCVSVGAAGMMLAEVLAWRGAYGGGWRRLAMGTVALFVGASSAAFGAASPAAAATAFAGVAVVLVTRRFVAGARPPQRPATPNDPPNRMEQI
ncbi:TRAP transporter permease [Chelativorans salis]|uniref:TRAP transporter fused permease subunit n=1 Tax=Chelativorans salis TaxID=2978478 RepID=A0ABT2LHS1_9HYPH|nr:TRAP transporter fused permease subunit [Chelativorans sp. EGI FJ00035]MCT7374122.1 TRAP transporter fused permease subunit [Chelativorans sp. EGI FJ00035]